ncbi:hypothetical protein H1230_15720 [Paenibacillus sp. 19GGS1-52]|uniref:hypothetical protein n=1 Tax=Paenibacillus sp. 19GGS1-52 TaxID=2758563 RepID=UPI001EFAAD96|nr:hypothetical protein [Paenibacillus sp. 19GGS1-52]ULO10086.1 hypothetical protein H1230_15720 [Paenibacillus sp. 19GGS1-52]
MGFNLGGFNLKGLIDTVKEGGIGELLQNLPLDQLPLDQLLEKIPLDQLLSSSFLQKFTSFESLQDMLQQGGFSAASVEDVKSLPMDQLNEHVNQSTSFGSFKDMLSKAAEYYTQRK